MELDELQPHWRDFRAAREQEVLPEEALYAMLPSESVSPFRRILYKASHYVGVYGSILICCTEC